MSEPPQLPPGVKEGEIVAGKYLVEKIIGAGAVGVIVSARHILLDERVAIKFLLPQAMGSGDAVARFVQEARAAVRMRSEYTVRVTDVALLENGIPFIVMEYLEGSDLAALLTASGPLSVERAVEFVLQACEALAEAHGLGIVHRDLKPANLFVVTRADGTQSVKVLDFGISKMRSVERDDVGLTNKNVLLGSPLYMSPEQMESSSNVDPRTDIWALGVVLFELLTGDVPYTADSLPQLYAKILSNPDFEMPAGVGRLPPELEGVIRRCLSKDRTERFTTITELAEALGPLASVRGLDSVRRLSKLARTWSVSAPDSSNATSSAAVARGSAVPFDESSSSRGQIRRTGLGKGPLAIGLAVVAVAVAILMRAAFAPRPMHVEISATKPPLALPAAPGASGSYAPAAWPPPPPLPASTANDVDAEPSPSEAPRPRASTPPASHVHAPSPPRAAVRPRPDLDTDHVKDLPRGSGAPVDGNAASPSAKKPGLPSALSGSD